MFNGIIKFIVGTSLGIAVALLILFNVLLLWVATGPRSLNALSPYIAESFEPEDHSYLVSIGETWLIWDGWQHPIDLRLRTISVLTKEKQRICRFPEISLGLDVLALMSGRILPTSVTITHPVLSLFQNDDRSISFGFRKEAMEAPVVETATGEEMTSVPFEAILAPMITPDEKSSLRKLRMVSILNADVGVGSRNKGVFFKATDVSMVFKSNRRGLQAFGSAKIAYDSYQSLIDAQFAMDQGGSTLKGSFSFSQLMPGTLVDLFADKTVIGAMKFPVSGKGKVSVDTQQGILQQLIFTVDGGKGTLESDKLDGTVPVTTLHVEGQLTNNAHDIQISQLNADLDGMLIDADGIVSLKDNDAAINANFYLKNILAANVHLLWPPQMAPISREWITQNITEGVSPEAESHFRIAFGDIAKSALPKEDVDATIILQGAKVRYLPDHPELTHVKGSIHVDGVSLDAAIESGQYLKDTKMSGGKIRIDDLNVDNPYIKLSFDAESTAKDVVHFLGLPRLQHAQRLNLHEDTVAGTVKGHGAIGFTFFAPHHDQGKTSDDSDITYDIQATAKDITVPAFMEKFDIKNADGAVTVNNTVLEFKGSGEVNGASVSDSDVKYLFKHEGIFDTVIEASATAPVSVLPRFGYPAFPFLKGKLGIKATVKEGNAVEASQASFDLTNTSINVPSIGWIKPDKEPATFDISAEKNKEIATISSFHLKGKHIDAKGSAELNQELSDLRQVSMEKLVYGNTDVDHLVYERLEGGFKIDIGGKSIDLSPWLDSDEESTFSFEHFPAAQVKLDISKTITGKDRLFYGVKGELTCTIQRCESANVAGTTADNKPFAFRILRNPKGKRQLSLRAESAGVFLKAANLVDGMEGGALTITGSYTDSDTSSIFRGRADISEHVIKNAPVLAKILSLASLTGFFDTLQGKGIHFVKLRAPFTLSKDVITFKDAKTHGDAIGLLADGTITFPKRTLDIQGTIVPSYTLNNVLGNVPIVGRVLTGGEGQGVFAARYSIKGSGKQPDVSVNPLSILTPGFLRGLFDILDKPKKDDDEDSE